MGTFLQVMGWLLVASGIAGALFFETILPSLIQFCAGLVLLGLGTILRRLDAIIPKPAKPEVSGSGASVQAPQTSAGEWSAGSMGGARE